MFEQCLKILRFAIAIMLPFSVYAGEVTVAVASNFMIAASEIGAAFEKETGHDVYLVNGSTGMLFAQISQGAPYDVFLSADRERIEALEQSGLILDDKRKVYALGRLVLIARDENFLIEGDIVATMKGKYHKFAMASPKLAPYGRAAKDVLDALALSDLIESKAVLGGSIAQTAVFVKTGNAEIGFLAFSQLLNVSDGKWMEIPDNLYTPIEQEAAVLERAKGNPVAVAFFEYLFTKTSQDTIQMSGYRRSE